MSLAVGARAVVEATGKMDDDRIGPFLETIGKTLISAVGAAMGPLYGTACQRAGKVAGERTTLDAAAVAEMLAAARDGIIARGKTKAGDKTMLDAFDPAATAAASAAASDANGVGSAARRERSGRRGRDRHARHDCDQGSRRAPRGANARAPGCRRDVHGAHLTRYLGGTGSDGDRRARHGSALAKEKVMRVAIGSDDAGAALKETIASHLREHGVEVRDFGVAPDAPSANGERDYPDVAVEVAQEISSGREERGILICGTGIGMAIVANKVPGVRAAQAHDTYSAERARKSNDAQVLTLGARVIGPELAKQIVDAWIASDFAGGGSTSKVEKMNRIDESFRGAAKTGA